MRIPRPIGTTAKALQGKRNEVYESLSRSFLQGTFPYNMKNLSLEQFSIRFRIPLLQIHNVVKTGFHEETLLGDGNIRGVLDNIRFKLLDSTLYQHGATTAKTSRLVTYLENRVYASANTRPDLIRELNVALTSSHKGTDAVAKIIQLLNDAVASDIEPITTEHQMSKDEMFNMLHDMKPDLTSMLEVVKTTPSLAPTGKMGGVSTIPLKKVNGELNKAKNLKPAQIPEDVMAMPV